MQVSLMAVSLMLIASCAHARLPDVAADPVEEAALMVGGFGTLVAVCAVVCLLAHLIAARRRRYGIYRKYAIGDEPRARRHRAGCAVRSTGESSSGAA